MKEKLLTEKIKAYLKGVDGLFFWKAHGGMYAVSGVPDIICCYRGRFIGFEVKSDKGKATVLQELTIRQIIKAGGIALVVRSVEEVKSVIDSLKR
jgi:hypothetical protein